jgi:hypothetical protein
MARIAAAATAGTASLGSIENRRGQFFSEVMEDEYVVIALVLECVEGLVFILPPGTTAADQEPGVGALLEVCQRAIVEDGSPLGENAIRGILWAIAGRQYHRLSMWLRGDDEIVNRVSFSSHPIGDKDVPHYLGACGGNLPSGRLELTRNG